MTTKSNSRLTNASKVQVTVSETYGVESADHNTWANITVDTKNSRTGQCVSVILTFAETETTKYLTFPGKTLTKKEVIPFFESLLD
jgi:hypothetical protein